MNRVSNLFMPPSQSTASRLTTTMCSFNLDRLLPSSASSNLLDRGLQVFMIMAAKSVGTHTTSQPPSWHSQDLPSAFPNSLEYGLQVDLWVHSILPPSSSPHSLSHRLAVHLSVHSLKALKCVSKPVQSLPPGESLSSDYDGVVKWWSWVAKSASETHCLTSHSIQSQFVRRSSSGSRTIGTGWEDLKGYHAMKNHKNWVDRGRLGKSAWGTTKIAWIYENLARVHGTSSREGLSVYFV